MVNEEAAKGGFRIIMEGGVDLNIPEVTTITLEGNVTLEFKLPGAGPAELTMDLAFNVTLSETNVGNIGAAVGKFHVSIDTDVLVDSAHPVGGVEIWGAAILTTNFDFLKKIGLFASAEGLLRINSSDTAKPDEVLQNTAGTDVSIALPAESFALRLDGSVDFRIDYNKDTVFSADESVGLSTSGSDGSAVATAAVMPKLRVLSIAKSSKFCDRCRPRLLSWINACSRLTTMGRGGREVAEARSNESTISAAATGGWLGRFI